MYPPNFNKQATLKPTCIIATLARIAAVPDNGSCQVEGCAGPGFQARGVVKALLVARCNALVRLLASYCYPGQAVHAVDVLLLLLQ